jgi:lipopolysaccharide export system protein LptA
MHRRRTAAVLGAALLVLAAGTTGAQQAAAPRTAPAAKPAPVVAPTTTASPPGRGAGGGGSGGKPIEIQADRLVVDQDQELATFSGNVDAVQGELSLRADRLRVFYTEQNNQAGGGAAEGGGGTTDDQGIRRIEADGSVVLRQPGETAEGDAGVYDPVAGTMVLEGNVVLTRGQNVVRGTRLDSDLNTGVSVVTAAPAAGRGQRVRALFSPERGGEEGAAGQ